MSALRNATGRTIRNLRRNRVEGVGHDFEADVRDRLPSLAMRTIFDVGAHIGLNAIEYSDEFPQATVYAFEPHPANFARMKANLVGKPDAKLYPMGLGSEPGTLPFHFDPEHPTMARVVAHGEPVTDHVTIGTVDLFCTEHAIDQIDFMKIDVEGHEMPVLEGARQMLSEGRISLLKIETAIDPDLAYHTQLNELCDHLHPLGYRLFGFYGQWESTIEDNPKIRRFDVAFISPQLVSAR